MNEPAQDSLPFEDFLRFVRVGVAQGASRALEMRE
jgi:hypothetical protein